MRGRTAAALTFKHPRKKKWIWREPAFRLERRNSESLGISRVVTTVSGAAGCAYLADEQEGQTTLRNGKLPLVRFGDGGTYEGELFTGKKLRAR